MLCVVWSASAAYGDTASDAISRNAASLNRINSYYLKITGSRSAIVNGKVVVPQEVYGVIEIWGQGLRHRILQRNFHEGTPEGDKVIGNPHGQVIETSADELKTRQLKGWDPERPYQLPLEFGGNAKEFESVRGSITFRNPAQNITQVESTTLLWDVVPGFTIEAVAKVADIIVVAQPNDSVTRLSIKASTEPLISQHIGVLVDIDHAHGYMISRTELLTNGRKNINEALAFEEVEPGLWIPTQTRLTSTINNPPGVATTICKLEKHEINTPLEDEALTVNFPEGAKVVEGPNLKIHIWGKDKAAQTFTTDESYRSYIYSRAREIQQPQRTPLLPNPRGHGMSLLIIINLVLFAVLAILFAIRRFL